MKQKFPIVLKRGCVQVKIYRNKPTAKRRYESFVLVYQEGDDRQRDTFSDLDQARDHGNVVLERLVRGEAATELLQGTELLAYRRAMQSVADLGVHLDVAIAEYAELRRFLGNRGTPMEAARLFVASQGKQLVPKRVSDVIADLLVAREEERLSRRHIADLKSRLNRFARSFNCNIDEVRAPEIQRFLFALKQSPKSVNNFRTAISNLFNFAAVQGHILKAANPMVDVRRVKQPENEIGIYSQGDLEKLIAKARPEMLPYIVVAAFAGLRQSEIERLEWDKHVTDNHIKVPGGERCVKSKRVIEMLPNLRKWMAVLRQPSGKVAPFKNVTNQLLDALEKAGVASKHNGLRHSFASYRVAILNDYSKVSFEMGNSPGIVKKHYAEKVTRQQAEKWFSIEPAEVISLNSAAQSPSSQPPAPDAQQVEPNAVAPLVGERAVA